MSVSRLHTTLLLRDTDLAAWFARALSERPKGEASGSALVVEAAGGIAGLADDVARAVADFVAADDARALVFVASATGVGWAVLQGLTQSYAAAVAPCVRVNAIAPAHAGDRLDAGQATAALLYLLEAEAVTGQTVFTSPV